MSSLIGEPERKEPNKSNRNRHGPCADRPTRDPNTKSRQRRSRKVETKNEIKVVVESKEVIDARLAANRLKYEQYQERLKQEHKDAEIKREEDEKLRFIREKEESIRTMESYNKWMLLSEAIQNTLIESMYAKRRNNPNLCALCCNRPHSYLKCPWHNDWKCDNIPMLCSECRSKYHVCLSHIQEGGPVLRGAKLYDLFHRENLLPLKDEEKKALELIHENKISQEARIKEEKRVAVMLKRKTKFEHHMKMDAQWNTLSTESSMEFM